MYDFRFYLKEKKYFLLLNINMLKDYCCKNLLNIMWQRAISDFIIYLIWLLSWNVLRWIKNRDLIRKAGGKSGSKPTTLVPKVKLPKSYLHKTSKLDSPNRQPGKQYPETYVKRLKSSAPVWPFLYEFLFGGDLTFPRDFLIIAIHRVDLSFLPHPPSLRSHLGVFVSYQEVLGDDFVVGLRSEWIASWRPWRILGGMLSGIN